MRSLTFSYGKPETDTEADKTLPGAAKVPKSEKLVSDSVAEGGVISRVLTEGNLTKAKVHVKSDCQCFPK